MQFLTIPFFSALENSQNILIAGAGGGFDIFCGLPLYFALKNTGKQVHLANMSFSELHGTNAEKLDTHLFKVTSTTHSWLPYFPEKHLSNWFAAKGEDVPVYAIARAGYKPIQSAYKTLLKQLQVDTIILIDGGTDSLMKGDEAGLGTPQEDITRILAVDELDIPTKILVCLGFGVDTYHGVSHAQFLEAVAEITRNDGFLGMWSLTKEMPEVKLYQDVVDSVHMAMPQTPSIVSSSIVSAINGEFGNYHPTNRTRGSNLFINSLMSLYWCFKLDKVANRIMYRDKVIPTTTYTELTIAIETFRDEIHDKIRPWVNLPM